MTKIKTEDKIKEAKNSSNLFGMLFVFCLLAFALGLYWYLTSMRPFGLLVCAALLLVMSIGSLYARYYYSNKIRNSKRR